MSRTPDELVRRLAAGLRAAELYAPAHPLVQRSVAALGLAYGDHLSSATSVVVGFIGDDVVVNDTRLGKGSASLTGFAVGVKANAVPAAVIVLLVMVLRARRCAATRIVPAFAVA